MEAVVRTIKAILAITALSLAEAAGAAPRVLVHLSRCSGPELKKNEVQVIDLSKSADPQKELAKVLEERQLTAIRERSFRAIRSAKRALSKATKTAGDERCDAMIVLRMGKDIDPHMVQNPLVVGSPPVYQDSPEGWVEVIFAEPKMAGGNKEGG